MVENVYIHIPFCRQKCYYCSFVSFVKSELKEKYVNALITEIKNIYNNEPLKTLYFGGGTPSLLTAAEFNRVVNLFNITPETEVTIELNPENLSLNYLKDLKNTGINRLSFGCQTFNDQTLKLIGRRHSSYDVEKALEFAYDAGFNNISLDFIYGLPNQNIEDFANDLKKAAAKDIQHISLYGLKIDKNCYFYNHPPENLPDEDLQADMYLQAIKFLTDNEFIHYEISNFAKSGFYSKHNLNYWNNNTYYGFGIGAHGYTNGYRYENTTDFEEYFANPIKHKKEHKLCTAEQLEEEIFLGFRKTAGINIKSINDKFNINFEKKYTTILDKYLSTGHIKKSNGNYCLTADGMLLSNTVLADFLRI